MEEGDISGNSETGLPCLVIISRLYGLPADPGQLRHQFGRPGHAFTTADILRAARSLGLKAREIGSDWGRLLKTQLPAIGQNKDGFYFIIGQAADEKVLIQDPREKSPASLSREEFEQLWNGQLILFTRRAGILGEIRKFDFSWFIPAILKYKKLCIKKHETNFF